MQSYFCMLQERKHFSNCKQEFVLSCSVSKESQVPPACSGDAHDLHVHGQLGSAVAAPQVAAPTPMSWAQSPWLSYLHCRRPFAGGLRDLEIKTSPWTLQVGPRSPPGSSGEGRGREHTIAPVTRGRRGESEDACSPPQLERAEKGTRPQPPAGIAALPADTWIDSFWPSEL